MTQLTKSAAWQALQTHHKTMARIQMRDLFEQEPGRFERLSLRLDDLLLDYSKNRITTRTLTLLLDLAREAQLESWIERMFRGERINNTESRAALHVALRNRSNRPIEVDGADVMPAVNAVLARLQAFVEAVRGGEWTGHSGQRITDVVSIGIGGSHLGPEMATLALQPYGAGGSIAGPRLHFVSNVDGAEIAATLAGLDPATTLFVIISKTFTTIETLANAETARRWFRERAGAEADIAKHFVAVSNNREAVAAFGIDPAQAFEIWDWVGGRYSLWSAVGLPIALAVGFDNFAELLAGGHAMDEHFRTTPIEHNMPVLMALLGIWYANFFGAESHAVIPYDQSLRRFPAFLQQLDMESNGKRVTRDGEAIDHATAPVIWGEPGTNSQHAFFQALHQGTRLIPADFLLPAESHYNTGEHHKLLVANCLAQTEALMRGKSEPEIRSQLEAAGLSAAEIARLAPHRVYPGNRPTNTLLFRKLTPRMLGMLIALYEHRVFVQGVIWRINSFDQWGVELGKQLATNLGKELDAPTVEGAHDSSTVGLLKTLAEIRSKAG
jgi:glucose-6-phosphate isomerase